MQKKITRLFVGLVIGIFASIIILFILNNKDGKKDFSLKKLFTLHTLARLSRIYDLIMDGIPDEEKGITHNVLKALKSANTLYEELFQVRRFDKFMKFIEEENFELSNNPFIMPLIKNTKLGELIKKPLPTIDLGSGLYVVTLEFPDGDKIYLTHVDEEESDGRTHRSRHDGSGKFALSPNFNLEAKLGMFWDFYKEGVFIRSADPYENTDFSENSDNLKIEDLECIDFKFYGKTLREVDVFYTKLKKFRDADVQRSYLLLGKPGTGKTTFCIEIARRISNRIVKISAELFRQFDREDIDFIFKCLKPDSVVIDDFDRVYDDMADADVLHFFEQLKKGYGNVTVFCTVNDIAKLGEAIIRPGRFDEIKVFQLPDKKDRRTMLKSFIKAMSFETEPTPEQLNKLIEITEGFSPAYLKEYILSLKFDPDFDALVQRIELTKQFVDTDDFATTNLDET